RPTAHSRAARVPAHVIATLYPYTTLFRSPDDRYTSILRSDSSISTGPTSSGSGKTSTPAADVCTRPWDSVTGTRCTRWTPLELQSRPHSVPGRLPRPDGQRRVLDATEVRFRSPERLDDPPVLLRIPRVHPCQLRGEQRGLLAALPGFDLHEHVV